MERANARRLAEFCRDRVGPSVRTVTTYDAGAFETVYLRADLREVYTRKQFTGLIDNARRVHTQIYPMVEGTGAPIGSYETTVHTFDHAAVLQFYETAEAGHLASFDRDVGSKLTEFVTACRDVME